MCVGDCWGNMCKMQVLCDSCIINVHFGPTDLSLE